MVFTSFRSRYGGVSLFLGPLHFVDSRYFPSDNQIKLLLLLDDLLILFVNTIQTHNIFPYLPTLLEIIISVSGEEPLPVGGVLLKHHNHATKVDSLLLFLVFFFLPYITTELHH